VSIVEKRYWVRGVEHGKELQLARILEIIENFYDGDLWRQTSWSPDSYESFGVHEIIDAITKELDVDLGVSRDYYAGIKRGKEEERERILKLLNTERGCGDWATGLINQSI
jgi:predicted AAA+ superfamily ATPase